MARYNEEFIKTISAMPGHSDVIRALSEEASPVSIRLNPFKPMHDFPGDMLRGVPWEPEGYYLPCRPQFTFMPQLYAGKFYVQDASSMIIGEAIRRIIRRSDNPGLPLNVLDACAAPGGKTISAISALPEKSFVLANEYEADRCLTLADNLARFGTPRYAITRQDARTLHKLGPIFDIVIADLPCSGEGMMRKNPTAITQWSPKLVSECAALQREIVGSLWKTLKPGGWLIYSTCTFNTEENESNVRILMDRLHAESVNLGIKDDYPEISGSVIEDVHAVRMLPGRVDGEGQFMSVLRKTGSCEAESKFRGNSLSAASKTVVPFDIHDGFCGVQDRNGNIFAVENELMPLVGHIGRKANLTVPGTHVASSKGRGFQPAHPLATSLLLKPDTFPKVTVDYQSAMTFLRGEVLRLPSDTPRGYVLIREGDNCLGFANNIGSRANNLFPVGVRIRSTHIPAASPGFIGEEYGKC